MYKAARMTFGTSRHYVNNFEQHNYADVKVWNIRYYLYIAH